MCQCTDEAHPSRRDLLGAATLLSAAAGSLSGNRAWVSIRLFPTLPALFNSIRPHSGLVFQAFSNPEDLGDGFQKVYGEATSASSYGGYGGNDTGTDRYEGGHLRMERALVCSLEN